jgi:Protein of unknown function (DUF2500)
MDLSGLIPILIGLLFLVVIVGLLVAIVRAIGRWQYNNQQPVVSVQAQVVTKRTRVSGRRSDGYRSRTSTFYYCTFEDQQGGRHEFKVAGQEYGQLVEGDLGTLTYQGSRYHGFKRH